MERVADGVFAIIHDNATDEWPHGNTGVIIGTDGVLVVDSTYLPSRATADIALIRSVTDKPVRYLVITHWHFDHNNGSSAYRDAFPDVVVVSERESREHIALNQAYWSKMSTAPDSFRRAALKEVDARTAERRLQELRELEALEVVAPDLVFEGSQTLWLGTRRVDLADRGPANSPHDVTVSVPDAGVLFTGDILVQSPLPYVFAVWPLSWVDVLRDLEAEGAKVIVPGHGPVMHDHTYTRQVRTLFETVASRVREMIARGMTLDQIQAAADFSDVRRSVAVWAPADLDEDWKYSMEQLVERTFRHLRGQ